MSCVITSSAMESIRRHLAVEYPREGCGLLVGRDQREGRWIESAVATRNRAPGNHRYAIDPEEFLKAEKEARTRGLDVVGIYHSHPDLEPRPSAVDLREAWPHYTYLIVGVSARQAGGFEAWRLDGDGFAPEVVRVAPASEVAP